MKKVLKREEVAARWRFPAAYWRWKHSVGKAASFWGYLTRAEASEVTMMLREIDACSQPIPTFQHQNYGVPVSPVMAKMVLKLADKSRRKRR